MPSSADRLERQGAFLSRTCAFRRIRAEGCNVPRWVVHSVKKTAGRRCGIDAATVGRLMGQRSKVVTLETYTHALIDSREVDRGKLLERVSDARLVQIPVQIPDDELAAFAG